VALVAVSKLVHVERLHAAVAAGLTTLGENRVQEAAAKVEALPEVTWHLVGHLQGNKAARAIALFDVIESVDSVELAQRLDRLVAERSGGQGRHVGRVPVYLEANVDADLAKYGFVPDALERSLETLAALPNLDVRGLMTVGRLTDSPDDARTTFATLRELSSRLRARWDGLGPGLSMGMSDDFEVAVEEGATVVRVGRAIFGERHGHGPTGSAAAGAGPLRG
jgi:pyridoxal phosphate enzyme (YggS family)